MITIIVKIRGPVIHKAIFSLIGERFRCSLPYLPPPRSKGTRTFGSPVITTTQGALRIHTHIIPSRTITGQRSITWRCLGIRRAISSFGVVPRREEVARRQGLRRRTSDTGKFVFKLAIRHTANLALSRFLRMTHDSAAHNVTIVHASPKRPNTFISTTVPAKDLNQDIMDVAFVTVLGQYPGGEEELRKVHRFAGSVPLGRHWSYKYLVDLDGMSYSGRFMALMTSDSAVIKSTVYKEYFSDWLVPW